MRVCSRNTRPPLADVVAHHLDTRDISKLSTRVDSLSGDLGSNVLFSLRNENRTFAARRRISAHRSAISA
ncbi:MAG: hypothetical protein ACRDRR_18305 [Pseudonocardiaceae bacterium]